MLMQGIKWRNYRAVNIIKPRAVQDLAKIKPNQNGSRKSLFLLGRETLNEGELIIF
jgi:hypothetical protein